MLSALIHTRRGYPAVRLAAQPAYRRSVHHGPLVLVAGPRLSFERRPFHAEPPDHYAPVSCLLGVSPSQSSALMPLHSRGRLPCGPRAPLEASVTLLEATTPVKLPAKRCPGNSPVRPRTAEGPYFNGGSTDAGAHYTIRAGRNLPDKEFRYLRTVIVTAAVYRGFNSMLPLR